MLEMSQEDIVLPDHESETAELASTTLSNTETPALSPSPTPAFVGTDGPARARRRRRWKTGLQPRAALLSTFSFVLMVAGVGAYVADVPGMLAKSDGTAAAPMRALAFLDESAKSAAIQVAGASGTMPGAPLAATSSDPKANALTASLGLANSSSQLSGASSLLTSSSLAGSAAASSANQTGIADSFINAVEQAKKNEEANNGDSSDSSSGTDSKSDAGNGGGDSGSSDGDKADSGSDSGNAGGSTDSGGTGGSTDPTPSESDDPGAQKAAELYSDLNYCVTLMNQIVTDFDNDAMYGSVETRQAHLDACNTLDDLTLQGFISARNSSYESSSVWKQNKSALMESFMALDEYVTVYMSAWERNVTCSDPASNYDCWIQPIKDDLDDSGKSIAAAEFNAAYLSISL